MYVGVIHRIQDRDAWAAALRAGDLSVFPPEMELVVTGTSAEADRAVCLWKAPSTEFVQETLDRLYGPVASAECFAVPDEFAYIAASTTATAAV